MFKKKKKIEEKVEEVLDTVKIANEIVKKSELLIKDMKNIIEFSSYGISTTAIEIMRINAREVKTPYLLFKFEDNYEADQFLILLRRGYEMGYKVDEIYKKVYGNGISDDKEDLHLKFEGGSLEHCSMEIPEGEENEKTDKSGKESS